MAKLPVTLKEAAQGAASLTGAFNKVSDGSKKLKSDIEHLSNALNITKNTAKSFFAVLGAKAVFGEAGEALAKYNKILFDLSKTSKFTGDSYVAMKKGIDDVNKSTNLSLSESSKFFRAMQRGQQFVRLNAQETSNLAKTLSREYGPSLQDMSEGLEKLLSLQSKEINVLKNISRGMGTSELRAYTAGLIMYHKASEQEIEALLRVTRAMYDKDKAETAAERRTKQMSVAMKDLTKAGEDLLLAVAEPMSGAMMSIAKAITSVTGAVKDLVGDSGFKKILEMAPYVMTAGAVAAPLAGMKIAKAAFGKIGTSLAGAAGKGTVAAGMGALATGGSTAAATVGKAGMMGRVVGKIGSPIAMIGGLAAGYGGEKLQEAGHTRAGAALSAGGKIAGYAATGAALGGPFGAAAGTILGVVTSLDELNTAIFGATEATEKAAKANSWAADEAKKLGIGADELKTRYDDMFREQMGGRDLGELSQGEQQSFMKAQKSRMELSERSGVAPEKTKALLAVGIQENVAKSIAQAQASARGLSGEMAESFVKKSIQEFHQNGGGPAFASDFIKAMKDKPMVVQAEVEARKTLGITEATGPDFEKTMASEVVDREAQTLMKINKLNEDILGYTNQRIDANLQLADITYRYTGDMAKAQEYQDQASQALEAQRTSLTRLVGLMNDMVSGSALSKGSLKEIEESLKRQGKTEGEISSIMKNTELMRAVAVDAERKIGELKDKQQKIDSSGADRLAKSTALHAQDLSIMKADLELSKSLYLGLGPTLDQQMQISDTMLDQINYKQKEIDLQEEIIAKGGDAVAAQSKIKQLILEQKQIEKERLDITQNLREAYLQQMTAFTNVQGAFSKIILTQEQGAGEIMRQFGGPGSSKVGALGAGSNAPVARLKAGGGIDYMGPEQQKEAFDRYNRDMPEMSRTRVSEAGAAKETGEESRLRGEDLERQTGESPWRGRFFKEGGIVPGSGSGDIVPAMLEPGELVVPKNMAKGIRGFKDGGVAGAPGYRVVGTGGDQIITAQLDQLIKLSMRTVDVLEKGIVQSKKSDEEQARRDKVADQSKDRKRLEPDEKDAGKTKKEKEEEDRAKSKALQKAEEDKLIARQEEWMDYFNKQSSDVIMEPVNTSGLGIGNKAGHRVTGVDQQVKADRLGAAENYREEVKETWNQKQAREKKQREEEQASKEEKTLGEAASRPETYQKAESEYQQAQFNQENAQRQLALNKDIQKKHKGLSASGGGMSIFSRMDARDYLTGRPMSPEGKDRIENGAMIEGDPAMSVATTKQAKGEDEAARLKKELKRKRQEIKNTERSVEQNEKGTNVGNTGFGWAAPTQLPSLDMEGTVADQMLSGVKESWSNTLAKTIRDIDVPAFDFAGIRIGGGGQGKGAQTAQWEKKLLKAQKSEAEELEKKLKQAEEMTKAGKDEQEALKKGYAEKAKKREEEQKAIDESVKTAEHAVKLAGRDVSIAEGKRRSAKEEYEESKKSLEQARAGPEKTERKGRTAGIYEGGSLSTTPYQKKEAGIYKDGSLQDVKKKAGIYEGDGQIARPRSKKEAGIYEGESLSPTPMPKKEGEDDFRMKMKDGKWQKELIDTNKEQTKKVKEHAETGKKQVQLQEDAAKATAKAKETLERQQDKKPVAASSIGSREDMDKAVVSAIQGSIFGAGMARGGIVPGSGSGDRVPAMLEPGEFVVPKSIVNGIRGYKDGGVVSPSPTLALASSGTGASPQIALNVRGDSVNGIMKSVQGQLAGVLNKMMSPSGTSGRFFDLTQSG